MFRWRTKHLMEIRVCKNCRRLFKYIYGPEICPDCSKVIAEDKREQSDRKDQDNLTDQGNIDLHNTQEPVASKSLNPLINPHLKEEETRFDQVRDYIMFHPSATLSQISEANDVLPNKLLEWIREERLEFSDDSEYAWFTCEKCGTKIRSGRLCNRCKTKQY